ncbi:rhomboid family intramembrane serine protease [Ruficoccus amylovorans]|uniref:Rhomboid family intramembrane serine protease n=1 Tax=Ruficoccus amylovorans TaxID=1804625 RepID=A0A842H903_9BACT|nr:rhomboid family intramembrane serine protease [Ruficoccus amylovorans]MBC2593003.1 rhomboid family intramembrane serine protease [Ruficoccus amylovorans]
MWKSLEPAPAPGNPKHVQAPVPEGLTVVGSYESFRAANERALVVLSMRLSYRMIHEEGRYLLCVDTCHAGAVQEQLDRYEQENAAWPPPAPVEVESHPAALGLWIYAGVLVAFFIGQQLWPGLEQAGMNDSQAVTGAGQLWRCFTALLLHADIAHLAGNLVSGLCLIWLVVQIFGNRLGWLLVIASGVMGNGLCAWLYRETAYRSLGASTAIFGALGLLVGHALAVGFNPEGMKRLRSRLVPLAAGLTVLVMTGTGGEQTDILAHVAGFTAGGLLGLIASLLRRGRRERVG